MAAPDISVFAAMEQRLLDLARELHSAAGRPAGSDAERRAALTGARTLRVGSRSARVETLWVRPESPALLALFAAAGVAASVLCVRAPVAGAILAAVALVVATGEATGRLTLLRRLLVPARATQNVVSPAPPGTRRRPVTLVIAAALDTPRTGVVQRRLERVAARARRRLGGRLPGSRGVLVLALALVAASAVARIAGVDARWLGVVQLVPTVALIALLGLLLDGAAGEAAPGGGSAAAVAVALARALDARPLQRLAVEVVLAGAGEAGALGMAQLVRAQQRAGRHPGAVAVLHVGPCGSGTPAYWTREGALGALRYHPRLVAIAGAVAASERHLRAVSAETRTWSGARVARAAGWPAIRVGCADADGVPVDGTDAAAMRATLELCLALVARLDAELAGPAAAARRHAA
jgi:hypothetical protein